MLTLLMLTLAAAGTAQTQDTNRKVVLSMMGQAQRDPGGESTLKTSD